MAKSYSLGRVAPGALITATPPLPSRSTIKPYPLALRSVRDQVAAALRTARPDLMLDDQAAGLDSTLPPEDFSVPETAEGRRAM